MPSSSLLDNVHELFLLGPCEWLRLKLVVACFLLTFC